MSTHVHHSTSGPLPPADFSTDEAKWQAISIRDPRAEGKFVYAASTTLIVCRPTCASKLCLKANIVYFPDIQTALAAGYKPCKRCRPEDESWNKQRAIVSAACRLLKQRAQNHQPLLSLDVLSQEMKISKWHFLRVFKNYTKMTPKEYYRACVKAGNSGKDFNLELPLVVTKRYLQLEKDRQARPDSLSTSETPVYGTQSVASETEANTGPPYPLFENHTDVYSRLTAMINNRHRIRREKTGLYTPDNSVASSSSDLSRETTELPMTHSHSLDDNESGIVSSYLPKTSYSEETLGYYSEDSRKQHPNCQPPVADMAYPSPVSIEQCEDSAPGAGYQSGTHSSPNTQYDSSPVCIQEADQSDLHPFVKHEDLFRPFTLMGENGLGLGITYDMPVGNSCSSGSSIPAAYTYPAQLNYSERQSVFTRQGDYMV